MTKIDPTVPSHLIEGCNRVYEERKKDKFKAKKEINGKVFQEINTFRNKFSAAGVAKDYKRCGFQTRVIPIYGEYMLLVRKA